jgi:hypothetical protein
MLIRKIFKNARAGALWRGETAASQFGDAR